MLWTRLEWLKYLNGNNDLLLLFGISFCTLHAFAAFSLTFVAGCIFVCFDMVPMKCRQKNKLNYLGPTPIFSTGEIPNAISLFRVHSYPTWEDTTNQKGFEWSIRKFKDYKETNELWKKLIMMAVSEDYQHSEILNGVRIVDCTIDYKVMYRVEIWFSDKKYKEYFETKIKEILNLPHYTKLLYREHSTLKENR